MVVGLIPEVTMTSPALLAAIVLGLATPAGAETSRPSPQAADIVDGSAADFRTSVGDRVFFQEGNADLTDEAMAVLRRQAEWLKRYPSVRVRVVGHSDDRNWPDLDIEPEQLPALNRWFGEVRAAVVATQLRLFGVARERIEIATEGDTNKLDPRDDAAARSVNRNVQTVIVSDAAG